MALELAVLAKIVILNNQVRDVQGKWENFTAKKFRTNKLKKLLEEIEGIFTAKLKEGFVNKRIKVFPEQDIPYHTLQKYFDYVVFAIIH